MISQCMRHHLVHAQKFMWSRLFILSNCSHGHGFFNRHLLSMTLDVSPQMYHHASHPYVQGQLNTLSFSRPYTCIYTLCNVTNWLCKCFDTDQLLLQIPLPSQAHLGWRQHPKSHTPSVHAFTSILVVMEQSSLMFINTQLHHLVSPSSQGFI